MIKDTPKPMRLPNPTIDYTSKDYEAFRTDMIKYLQKRIPTYTDTSQTDAGVVIIEALARGLDILSYYQDTMANEAFFSTSKDRESGVKWSKGLGYVPKNRTSARFEQVFVLNSILDTDYLLYKGTKVRTPSTSTERSETFEIDNDFVIPKGKLGNEVDEEGKYLYTTLVSHGITISDDLLGTSTGQPDQEFKLSYKGALADDVAIVINEGAGFERWTQVKTFMDSTKTDKHYTVFVNEADETVITFGNDLSGKIPTPFINGIYAHYRVGGGVIGNVSPMSIIEMVDNLANISKTFNPYEVFEYGVERESLEEIKVNAPSYLRTLWRATHINDHSDLLLINFNKVQFAKAIQNEFDRNAADIWIYLKGGEPLTEDFINELYEFFDLRKMVGNSVIIHPAEFNPVTLVCSAIIKDDHFIDDTVAEAEEYLKTILAEGNIDFYTEIPLALLEAETLHAVKGLRSFRITEPLVDSIISKPYQITTLEKVSIKSVGGRVRANTHDTTLT